MTTRRFGTAAVGLAFLALSGAACNLIDFRDRTLQHDPPPPVDTPTEEPRMCTPAVAEATPEYEAMCWHYCNMLEVTLHYAGTDEGSPGLLARSCYEVRCVPRCVTQDVCVQQCHALGVQYQAVCGGAEIGPGTICPVSVDDEVTMCLTGCAGMGAPPPPDVVGR